MSDTSAQTGADVSSQGGATQTSAQQAGRMLREAREAAGLHLAAVASTIKIPAARLEALEAGRIDELHDAVFVRALVGSVARVLRIDPAPVLALLPRGSVPVLAEDVQAINTPFQAPGQDTRPSWRDVLTRPGVLVVAALLVGALVLLVLPELGARSSAPRSPAASSGAAPVLPSQPPAASGAPDAPTSLLPAPVPSVALGPSPPAASSGPTAGSPPLLAASSPQPPGMLTFVARGTSWIEVLDAGGTPLLRRNAEAGERIVVDGTPPLRVTVGRAADVNVVARGKPFDLAGVTRDNVARFEVR